MGSRGGWVGVKGSQGLGGRGVTGVGHEEGSLSII